jgi:hypothetical protein
MAVGGELQPGGADSRDRALNPRTAQPRGIARVACWRPHFSPSWEVPSGRPRRFAHSPRASGGGGVVMAADSTRSSHAPGSTFSARAARLHRASSLAGMRQGTITRGDPVPRLASGEPVRWYCW